MTLVIDRELNGGTQQVHKFENGYGASVVKHSFSYGGDRGLYELAVLSFYEGLEYELDYSTEITDDVIGHLTMEDVSELLVRIEALEAK